MATDQEKIAFANAAIEQLEDDEMVEKFKANVKQVGTQANAIDASFDLVTRKFNQMVNDYGKDFPGFSTYRDEWVSYNKRWVKHLALSRDVASETVAILRRFDQVFLDMVESIETEQDRKDVIVELQQFIDEKHDKSTEMSEGFLTLKRDIEDYVRRLDQWIKDKGAKLEKEAGDLKLDIEGLQAEIEVLDKKIKDSTTALAVCGGCLNVLGVVVAGSVLASFKAERNDKAKQLRDKQSALEVVNLKQKSLTNLQSDFDGVKPDIALICARLVLFAEIWSSVRSQAVQFQEHLKGGMDALTNLRFKKEVRTARKVCKPLQDGLQQYAVELENRNKAKAT